MLNERVILRAVEPDDIDFIYQLENDPENWHVSNTIVPFSRFAVEQYVLSSNQDIFALKQLRLIIIANDSPEQKLIGAIDLFDFDPIHKRAGIGIIIISEEQRKGYATATLKLIIDYCFNTLALHQIYCNVTADNKPSLDLFQKLGFVSCGVKSDWIFQNNGWKDEHILQLLYR